MLVTPHSDRPNSILRLAAAARAGTPRRVATVNTNISGGGAATVARTIWLRIVEDAHFASKFFYSFGASSPSDLAERIGNRFSKAVAAMGFRLFGTANWLLRANTTRYLRRLRRFDLVHLHNLHGYYVDPLRLLRRLDRPFVWTLHDSWLCTGRCALAFDCEGWQNRGCRQCANLAQPPATWWFDRAAGDLLQKRAELQSLLRRQAGYLVTPSNWLRSRILAIGVPPERVRVIRNPVDTAQFRPATDKLSLRRQLHLPPDRFLVLLSAARLRDPLKGADHMRRLLAHFRHRPEVHFVCVGAARPESQQAQVSWMGYVDSPDLLAKIYAACDLFVSTSLAENFPMCVAEAMACGLPVVAFRVGGIPEQICQQTGVLVDSGDTEAMIREMEAIASDGARTKLLAMAHAARAKCERLFSLDRIIAEYAALYDELLESTRQNLPAAA